ncbi:response regulator [Geotalea toluenoxydans]
MRKILLVSDSPSFRERNKALLEKARFRLFTAASALEALQLQREIGADLIIAMLDLPDMGGDMLCSMIRQDNDTCLVPMMLVCYHSPEAMARAERCGANAWIIKPVHPHLLLREVCNLLTTQKPREHRVKLKTHVNGIYESMKFSGISHNISVSGVLCETALELAPDDLIKNMSIKVNAGEVITDGKVVRKVALSDGRFNYGVQFLNPSNACRQQIGKFVAASLVAHAPLSKGRG